MREECPLSNCEVESTSVSLGCKAGIQVRISGVPGLSAIKDTIDIYTRDGAAYI